MKTLKIWDIFLLILNILVQVFKKVKMLKVYSLCL